MRCFPLLVVLAVTHLRVGCDCGSGAGPSSDAGPSDAGASDAGASDAGASDAGAGDAGGGDAGAGDAGGGDAGAGDAGAGDAGAGDAGPTVVDLSAGVGSACAVISTGVVKCWGFNASGQLGNGSVANTATPTEVSGIVSAVSVRVASNFACALLDGGSVACWGDNTSGQLGNNSTTASLVPVPVSGIAGALALAAGGQTDLSHWGHGCVLMGDQTVRCWGDNFYAELGDGTTINRLTPVAVNGVSSAIAIAATGADSCALLAGGQVTCWGTNNQREIVGASGIRGAVALAGSSTGDSYLVVLDGGRIQGWGHDLDGQLGDGTTGSDQAAPVNVPGISNAIAVTVEGYTAGVAPGHGCALLFDGTLRCWADNNFGQLGNGATQPSLAPVTVTGIDNATVVSAGNGAFTCAVLAGRTVDCWGNGDAGELGPGLSLSDTPVPVPGVP